MARIAVDAVDKRLLQHRLDFPALDQFVWLQNGGVSLVPRPVHEVHTALIEASFRRGPLHIAYPDEEYPRRAASRARIARFLGADHGEVAVVRGVSEAFAHVMRSIDWQPGDELILSDDEESALLVPAIQVRDERGVRLRFLHAMSGDADAIVGQADQLLGSATRLFAFSHVTTDIGARLPAARLCRLAEERGVPTFVDLAHSAGAIEIDLHAMQPSYAGALSYKWMMAPYAAGALYVRADRLESTPVVFAGGRSDATFDRAGARMQLHADTRRFEYGPWGWPLVHAWAASIDYLSDIGCDVINARTQRLGTRLKTALLPDERVRLFTPLEPERSANLVAFGVAGWHGRDLKRYLRERDGIVVRSLDHVPDGVRASVAFFTSEDEVDRLVEAISSLPAMPP